MMLKKNKEEKQKQSGGGGGFDWVAFTLGLLFFLAILPCCCLILGVAIAALAVSLSKSDSGGTGGSSVDPNLQNEVNYILSVFNSCDISNSTCPVNNITLLEHQVEVNTEILQQCNLTLDGCGGVQGPPGANGTCTDNQCNATTLQQEINQIDDILQTCLITNTSCPDHCWNCTLNVGTCLRSINFMKAYGDGSPNQDLSFTGLGTGAFTVTEEGSFGDCRGEDAVDLQRRRSSPDQVCSGDQCVLLNGFGNKNAGKYSVVSNGRLGTVLSDWSLVGTGDSLTIGANSSGSAILVGNQSTIANSPLTVIVGGVNNSATNSTTTVMFGVGLRSIAGNSKPVAIFGQYNDPSVTYPGEQMMLAIGSGSSDSSRLNAFTVSDLGHVRVAATGSFTIGGAYQLASWMEHEEPRRLRWGSTVKLLPNGKFKECLPGERPDFVVVPPNGGLVSNAAESHWHAKYLLNEKTLELEINPLFSDRRPYLARSMRPEWHVVTRTGLVQVLNRAAKNYERWTHLNEKKTDDPLKSWWYL